jgi:hypothetical protein
MSDATTTSGARQGLESTPCSLTAFVSFAFILVGISAMILIVGLAVWLPVEIEKDGETIKERNDIYFKVNGKISHE